MQNNMVQSNGNQSYHKRLVLPWIWKLQTSLMCFSLAIVLIQYNTKQLSICSLNLQFHSLKGMMWKPWSVTHLSGVQSIYCILEYIRDLIILQMDRDVAR